MLKNLKRLTRGAISSTDVRLTAVCGVTRKVAISDKRDSNISYMVLKRIALLVACAVCAIVGRADSVEIDGIHYNYYDTKEDGRYASVADILKCNGDDDSVIIPSHIEVNGEEYPVTGIGWINPQLVSLKVRSVYLPEGLISIGSQQFKYTYIERVNIPSTVESIEYSVTSLIQPMFRGCTALREVVINDGVRPLMAGCLTNMKVNWAPFAGCQNIEKLYLGRNLLWSGNHPTFTDVVAFKEIITSDYVSNFEGLDLSKYSALETFVIGASVLKVPIVGSGVLHTVVSKSPFPPAAEGFTGLAYMNATLYVPSGSADRYRDAEVWKNFYNIVETNDFDDLDGIDTPISLNEKPLEYDLTGNHLTLRSQESVDLYDMMGRHLGNGHSLDRILSTGVYILKTADRYRKFAVQ